MGRVAAVVLGLAIMVVTAWALFVPIAAWIAHHDVGSVKGSTYETAVDSARGRLLTLGAGLFAAGALLFTARNYALSREAQVTDRYTKAVEQLGSDKLDVRIGGIYALERVARDSARDHPTVMEVLAAFIREHSHEPWEPNRDPDWRRVPREALGPRPDVQAAATVIGRRDASHDREQVNLTAANLTRAQLPNANFAGCRLYYVNLTEANLFCANLRRVELVGADLTGANFNGCNLYNANFTFAILKETLLSDANLKWAIFSGAKLAGQSLRNVDLTDVQAGTHELGDGPIPDGWESDPATWRLKRSKKQDS